MTRRALARRLHAERGSITVVAAAVMALVAVLTMGAADVGKALVARERAQAAADAAALAAAQELVMPSGRAPAELAAEYAAQNGATLASCACAPGTAEAVVEARVVVGNLLLVPGDHEAVAVARATVVSSGDRTRRSAQPLPVASRPTRSISPDLATFESEMKAWMADPEVVPLMRRLEAIPREGTGHDELWMEAEPVKI